MNLYLTGFMGAGKSAVARALARRLGRRCLDLDREVERRSKQSIPELFARGEAAFRKQEASALGAACRDGKRIVALGGGTLLSAANRSLVSRSGILVWLTCSQAVLKDRLAGSRRPLLTGQSNWEALREARLPGYRSACLKVSTSGRTARQSAALVEQRLRSRGWL